MLSRRSIWWLAAIVIGLLVFSRDVQTLLINRASVEISEALINGVAPRPLPELTDPARHGTEQSLRLSVTYQCVRGNIAIAESLLQRYLDLASPRQMEQMKHWVATWSLRLADRGELASAEQAMGLLFVFDDKAMAYLHLGKLYQELGYVNKAEVFLRKSLAVRANAEAFMQFGSLYTVQGIPLIDTDYQEAMQLLDLARRAFESAAHLDPAVLVTANYHLGDIYWKLNRREDAVRAYQRAAENSNTGHFAFLSWYYLGQIYGVWWNGGLDQDLSRSYFERALDIAGTRREEAMSLSGIAMTYAMQGRTSEALATYRHALRRDPDYEPARRAIDNLQLEP